MGHDLANRLIKCGLTLRGDTLLDCGNEFLRGKQTLNALLPRQKLKADGDSLIGDLPNHTYGSAYLRGRMEREAGLKRRLVLTVSNVVAAVGLTGLLSYGFLGGAGNSPVQTVGTGPTLKFRVAQKIPELTIEDVVQVAPLVDMAPSILRAAIDDTAAQLTAEAGQSAPVSTGTVMASFEIRRLVIGPDSAKNASRDRPVIRQASLSPAIAFGDRELRQDDDLRASLRPRPDDADDFSAPDSVFLEDGLTRHREMPLRQSPVQLTHTEDGNASLQLAFTPPAFVIRDIDPADRADLIEADRVAKLRAQEKTVNKDRRIAQQRYCMAAAVYYEARGESYSGQMAVAQVVMNRVASSRYPGSICGVVFQGKDRRNRCQFSFACDGRPERPRPGKSWNQALKIAKIFEAGERYSKVADATHYHADYVRPRWSRSMRRISKIGRHIFLNGV